MHQSHGTERGQRLFRLTFTPVLAVAILVLLAACTAPAPPQREATRVAAATEETALPTSTRDPSPAPSVTITPSPIPVIATAVVEAGTPAAAPVVPVTADTTAAGPSAGQQVQAVESHLLPPIYLAGSPAPTMVLAERMAHYNVPGVSVAVIEAGQVAWAKGYGVQEAGESTPVTSETLFQAASISKPVTAFTVLRLVRAGQLDLDADVAAYLKSWQLPATNLTASEKVTLRRLLNHTAGTTVNGFGGYSPGDPLPTTAQILSGQPPANSRPVTVRTEPGSVWNYSGGGYVLVQQIVEDVAGKPFAEAAREQVLEPLGMTSSTFEQPLEDAWNDRVARGHNRTGQALPGGGRVYPEVAPAGLWSTATDIAKFAVAIQEAAAGEPGALLDEGLAEEMLSAGQQNWGIGVQLGGPKGARWFAHGGSNAGYRARMVAFVEGGQGAVVLTNGDNGIELFNEILRAVADVYGWPDLQAKAKTVAAVRAETLEELRGRYEIVDDPGYGFDVEPAGDRLTITSSDGTVEYLPESDLVYFDLESGLEITFMRDASGKVTELQTGLPTGSGLRATRVQ